MIVFDQSIKLNAKGGRKNSTKWRFRINPSDVERAGWFRGAVVVDVRVGFVAFDNRHVFLSKRNLNKNLKPMEFCASLTVEVRDRYRKLIRSTL